MPRSPARQTMRNLGERLPDPVGRRPSGAGWGWRAAKVHGPVKGELGRVTIAGESRTRPYRPAGRRPKCWREDEGGIDQRPSRGLLKAATLFQSKAGASSSIAAGSVAGGASRSPSASWINS